MIARPTQISGSPGTIVGDDTRTSVRPGCSEPRHPYAATTLARTLGRAPALARQNGATRGKSGAAAPRHARTPSTRAAIPTPQRPPYGRVLAMIIRMRLRAGAAIPGRLGTHPLCPPIVVYGG